MKNQLLKLIAGTVISLAGNLTLAAEKWDMPIAYNEVNFHTQTARAFAEAVKIATGGELEIVVHSGGSLFKGNEIKRAVQTGQAQIGDRVLSAHANENALFAFDSVPFLATSFEEAEKLLNAALPKFNQLMDKNNLVFLYSIPWPPQGIYTKKPLKSINDLRGVKFRSYNNTTARIAELSGATPVQVEAAELSQALATGVAESFISSGATGYDRKVWEHLTHWYDVRFSILRNYVFVNKQAWESLDKKTQNIVRGIAFMTQKAGTAQAKQLGDWYLNQLKNNGMVVEQAGQELAEGFNKIGKKMMQEWLDETGETGQAILDTYHKK